MSTLNTITPEDIVRLRNAYEPLFEPSHRQMRYVQNIIDGNYQVMRKKVPGLTEYHPTHLFGRLLKTIDRVAATKPKLHIEPDGKGRVAKAVADKAEEQLQSWLYAIPVTSIMHPWRGLAYFANLRGKAVGCGPTISDLFRSMMVKRNDGESAKDFELRSQKTLGRLAQESVFSYTPIDPIEIIHPPTTRTTPPWVIRRGEMEISAVRQAYPFWSDPLMKMGKPEGKYVTMTAFCSERKIALLADGEPVSNRGSQNGVVKGEVLDNPYGRVFYKVIYSGRGYLATSDTTSLGGMSAEARAGQDGQTRYGPTTPEERLTVGMLDNNIEDILLQAIVMTAARVYVGRWAIQAFRGGMSEEDFNKALNGEVIYFEQKQGQPPVEVVPQPQFPTEILGQLFGNAGGNIELNTMPDIGMGVRVPGITSGYQTRTQQAPIDLQSVALRESLEHVIEDTARECIYAAKYVMTAEQAEAACGYISRDDLPDAPDIRVELAPPDEEARARRASLAEKIKDKLDDDTLREEFGFENSTEIRRKLNLDRWIASPSGMAIVEQLGLQKFALLRQQAEIRKIATTSLQNGAPTNVAGTMPVAPMQPTPPAGPGSPEEMQQMMAQGMRPTVPVPAGVPAGAA